MPLCYWPSMAFGTPSSRDWRSQVLGITNFLSPSTHHSDFHFCKVCRIQISHLARLLTQVKAISNNLNHVLEHDRVSNPLDSALSSQTFIGYFIKGLSAMRSISSVSIVFLACPFYGDKPVQSLAQGSEPRLSYIKRCKQAFEFIQGLEHICSHPRLTYWISWGRSLETIS